MIVVPIILAAATALPAPNWEGMWRERRILGPELRGAITVDRGVAPARAALGAFVAEATRGSGGRDFSFAGARGELRIAQWPSGETRAYWIQPPGFVNEYAYATPLTLHRVAATVWRGFVQPNDDVLDLDLVVGRRADGALHAFIHEPGYNVGLHYGDVVATPDGHRLRLPFRDANVTATFHAASGALSLQLPDFAPLTDVLHRVADPAPTVAPGVPLDLGDGWPVAAPATVRLDAPLIATLEAQLAAQPVAYRAPDVHALLVARHGMLVVDDYFDGYGPQRAHDLRSASKSFDAALVGLALAQAQTVSPASHVTDFFNYPSLANDSARKRRITIVDLLTMRSGLACDDYDDTSVGNEDTLEGNAAQPDWYRATLDLPMVTEPGTVARYCSMGLNLLGGVIARATREWLPLFFDERLGAPLQFDTYHMQVTPTGEMYLGGGSYLRPRDFLKLGQIFLDGGSWHNRRILDARWVAASLRPAASLQTAGDYAYGWHLASYAVGDRRIDTFEAGGNGGQILVVAPALDIVAFVTGGNYGDYRTWSAFHELLRKCVLAAAR